MNKEDLLKIFKNKNNRLICLILIIGVVLMAVASVDKNKKADVQPTAAVTSVEDEEKRLANILSQIDGAGEVSVMITYYSSSEKNIAYETKVSSREKEESEDKKAVGGKRGVSKSQRCYRDCRRGRKQCGQKCYFRGCHSIT